MARMRKKEVIEGSANTLTDKPAKESILNLKNAKTKRVSANLPPDLDKEFEQFVADISEEVSRGRVNANRVLKNLIVYGMQNKAAKAHIIKMIEQAV